MREDIIELFCLGKTPIQIIKETKINPKTAYYYHSMYKDFWDIATSPEFVNQIIRLLIKMRKKESGRLLVKKK